MLDQLKGLGGLGDLGGLMQKAQELQEQMRRMQEELAKRRTTADAGAGIVEATVNGRLELVKLRIDRDRLGTGNFEQADVEMLEDLIVAAVAAAQSKAGEAAKEEMGKMAGGLGLPPGMLPG